MKILSINGSGTGGYRATKFLSFLEKELDKPIYEIFDLIVGVSSGSIVGAALSIGIPCEETMTFFKKLIPEIFKDPRNLLMNLFYPKYRIENLINVLKTNLNMPMNEVKTKFMTYALGVDGEFVMPRHWKSWKDTEIPLYQPVTASSCAPTYFKPYKFKDIEKGIQKEISFIDGGMVSNNPTMSAYAEAIKMGVDRDDIFVLNIGSGMKQGSNASNYNGIISIVKTLPFDILASSERIDEYQAKYILGENCIDAMPDRITPIDLQDFVIFDAQAITMWEMKKDVIIKKLI